MAPGFSFRITPVHMTINMKFCLVRRDMTLCKQQRELKSKRSEMEKGGEKTYCLAVLCGENYALLALFSFSIKVFKICALILGRSVYLPNIS
jgi:hypothetical protein